MCIYLYTHTHNQPHRVSAVKVKIFRVSSVKMREREDFPGGTVDRNPPTNAWARGSVPGPGRFHTMWSN